MKRKMKNLRRKMLLLTVWMHRAYSHMILPLTVQNRYCSATQTFHTCIFSDLHN